MSQAPVILPGSPLTGAAAAADMSTAWAAMISKFSGTSAPTLGPGAAGALVEGQNWINTSISPHVWNVYDGAFFLPFALIDPVNHNFYVPGPWKNILSDNGSLEVWQRGAGSSASIAVGASTTLYTADRWYLTTGANQVSTVAAVAAIANQGNLAAKVQRNNGQTGTTQLSFGFPLDSDEIARLRLQKVSLSAFVKAGANWSPASGTLTLIFTTGTGAVGKLAGFAGSTTVITTSVNLAVSQQVFMNATSAVIVPANATQAEVTFQWTPVGTAGADDSITIDDVQLEFGTLVSTFELTPFEKSLLGCKRHFWKSFLYGTAPVTNAGTGTGELFGLAGKVGATAGEFIFVRHPVSLRATPSVVLFNPAAANAQVRDESVGADCSASSTNTVTTEHLNITATGAAGTAVGSALAIHVTVDAGI